MPSDQQCRNAFWDSSRVSSSPSTRRCERAQRRHLTGCCPVEQVPSPCPPVQSRFGRQEHGPPSLSSSLLPIDPAHGLLTARPGLLVPHRQPPPLFSLPVLIFGGATMWSSPLSCASVFPWSQLPPLSLPAATDGRLANDLYAPPPSSRCLS